MVNFTLSTEENGIGKQASHFSLDLISSTRKLVLSLQRSCCKISVNLHSNLKKKISTLLHLVNWIKLAEERKFFFHSLEILFLPPI
jgi:hypothetical protein